VRTLRRVITFDGQVAIVTGAGRGLGRAYALELARRGAQVVVNDTGGDMAGVGVDPSVADAVVAEIEGDGGSAVASHDSVATSDGGEAIVHVALDAFGRVDALVTNAGILDLARFDEITAEHWRRTVNVHLDGAFHVAQPAFRAMKQQQYGRIVLVSSNSGVFGRSGAAHYSAAKAGIVGLANALAIEGARHGILANTVLPMGLTRMVSDTVDLDAMAADDRAFFEAMTPERVAPLVAYLASRDCEVTHQNFSAAAGCFARVFVGLTPGWTAGRDSAPTAEDIAAHWAEISASDEHIIPFGLFDEAAQIRSQLGI
jgi:NAD(P)-dependent dehydrogenase (short-subunit alcohol dehydrogenase family)